jgi:hypothetical protein
MYNEVFYENVVAGSSPVWGAESLRTWQTGLAEATAGMTEIERDRYHYEHANEFIRNNPGAALGTAWLGAVRFWQAFPHQGGRAVRMAVGVFFLALLAMALVGAAIFWRRRPIVPLIVYMLLAETLVHVLYWSNIRMRLPFHPLLAVLAAGAVAVLFGRRSLVGEVFRVREEDSLYSPAV